MFLKTCNASRCAVTATVVLTKMISPRTAYQKLRQNYSHSEPVFPTRIPSTRPATVDRMISSTNRFPIPPQANRTGVAGKSRNIFSSLLLPHFKKAGRRLKKRHQSMQTTMSTNVNRYMFVSPGPKELGRNTLILY